ncbi:hypothetical protein HYS94_00740 [Candidatus Daviesbacteria bacterium]|nr:hypothetical protein [Candidatus Daviesbacteria bacterium]
MTKFLKFVKTPFLLRIFIYSFIFIFCLYIPKDPDLGWHLKYGEYFFQHRQILMNNTFSVEMPDYKYINSAWLTDVITYLAYYLGGFWGISILAAVVLTLTFFFFSKASKLTLFQETFVLPLVLLFEAPLFRNSFRGYMLSFLGLSILFYILSKNSKKALLLLPPLFLIWVNFHGQFVLGLGLFLIWIAFKLGIDFLKSKDFSKLKYEAKFLSVIFLSSVLVTFINPFGADIYKEVFRHASNTSQKYIQEWSPVDDYSFFWWQLYVWLFLIGIGSLIIIYKKKLFEYAYFILLAFALLFASFEIRRYIWVTLLLSIPIIKHLFSFSDKLSNFLKNILISIMLILGLIFIIFIKIPDLKSVPMNWDTYCNYLYCSPKSAEFLESHLDSSTLLSDFNFGGWLIWNYPKIKPTIDGRMAFWQDETGYNAFYNYVLIETNQTDIDQTKYDLVYISIQKPLFGRLIQLVQEGKWEIIYDDPYAFIFKRK